MTTVSKSHLIGTSAAALALALVLLGPAPAHAASDGPLQSSTLLGGTASDQAFAVAVDDAGATFVAGATRSRDFPTTDKGAQRFFGGGLVDGFVAKLRPDRSGLECATFLGGSERDEVLAVARDRAGFVYVAGSTQSPDFPTTPGALQRSFNGKNEAFVAKLDPSTCGLLWSTLLGGGRDDVAQAIAVDEDGYAYVAGFTQSDDFPTTLAAFGTSFQGPPNLTFGDAFVAKVGADGGHLVYATLLGGHEDDVAFGITVDATGSVYVAGATRSDDYPSTPGVIQPAFAGGRDMVVTRLSADGTAVLYSTYLGGSADDVALGVAVDGAGAAHVTGFSESVDFPSTRAASETLANGLRDAVVAKLTPDGGRVEYATVLGGENHDIGFAIGVDPAGAAHVVGMTLSRQFPTTSQSSRVAGRSAGDAFIAKLDQSGSHATYASVLGGEGSDAAFGVALGPSGTVHVSGSTASREFASSDAPDMAFRGEVDVFVVQLVLPGPP